MYDQFPDNNHDIEDIYSSTSDADNNLSSSKKQNNDDFKDIFSNSSKKSNKKSHKKKTKGKRVWGILWKTFVAVFLIGIITVSIVTTSLTIYVMSVVDDPDNGVDISQASANLAFSSEVVYIDTDGNEKTLAKFNSGQKSIWTDIEDIPNNLRNAFIYTEDETFYQHDGVNFKRTFAAFANMFLHFWEDEQGGSTITQQLVKNITNDRATSGLGGIERKIREIFRSMSVENRYSKSQILESYLNIVPLANNIYGVGAAAKFYFNKTPAELTLAECAALAAMTKEPEKYRPDTEKGAVNNVERRAYTLKKMYDFGAITSEEYTIALNETIDGTQNGYANESGYTGIESDFIDNLFIELSEDLAEENNITLEEAKEDIRSGGYKIYATIDPDVQANLEAKYAPGQDAVFASGTVNEGMQSAFVIMDYTGAVKGVVGRMLQEKTEPSPLNRATQSTLRIGSTIKPISIYAPAIKSGLVNFSTIVNGAAETGETDETENQSLWLPKNYENAKYGNVTIATAVAKSINTVAVRVGRGVGVESMFSFMQNDLKFTYLNTSHDQNISPMTIGSLYQGVYLDDLAASYQIFGNGGYHTSSHSYTEVKDATGEVVFTNPALQSTTQVLDEDSSYIMNRLLQGVITDGTGTAANLSGIEVVGKTGTTSDNYDRLFVGLTPDYVAAVWYGYDYDALIQQKQAEIDTQGAAEGWSEEYITQQKTAVAEEINSRSKDLKYSRMKGSAQVWANVMVDMPRSGKTEFDASANVEKRQYDPTTGSASYTSGVWGYYKVTDTPGGNYP